VDVYRHRGDLPRDRQEASPPSLREKQLERTLHLVRAALSTASMAVRDALNLIDSTLPKERKK
jgi:hypothetical protein